MSGCWVRSSVEVDFASHAVSVIFVDEYGARIDGPLFNEHEHGVEFIQRLGYVVESFASCAWVKKGPRSTQNEMQEAIDVLLYEFWHRGKLKTELQHYRERAAKGVLS